MKHHHLDLHDPSLAKDADAFPRAVVGVGATCTSATWELAEHERRPGH